MNNWDLSLPDDFVVFGEEEFLEDVVVVCAVKASHVCVVWPIGVPMMGPRDFDGVSVPSMIMAVEDVLSVLYEFLGVCKVTVDNKVLAGIVLFHKLNIRKKGLPFHHGHPFQ